MMLYVDMDCFEFTDMDPEIVPPIHTPESKFKHADLTTRPHHPTSEKLLWMPPLWPNHGAFPYVEEGDDSGYAVKDPARALPSWSTTFGTVLKIT